MRQFANRSGDKTGFIGAVFEPGACNQQSSKSGRLEQGHQTETIHKSFGQANGVSVGELNGAADRKPDARTDIDTSSDTGAHTGPNPGADSRSDSAAADWLRR